MSMQWLAPEDKIRAALGGPAEERSDVTEAYLINQGYLPHGWSGAAAYRARAMDDRLLAGRTAGPLPAHEPVLTVLPGGKSGEMAEMDGEPF